VSCVLLPPLKGSPARQSAPVSRISTLVDPFIAPKRTTPVAVSAVAAGTCIVGAAKSSHPRHRLPHENLQVLSVRRRRRVVHHRAEPETGMPGYQLD